MRLGDLDALISYFGGLAGDTIAITDVQAVLDNALTVSCEECRGLDRHWDGTIGREPTLLCGRAGLPRIGRIEDAATFGCSNFERRQP